MSQINQINKLNWVGSELLRLFPDTDLQKGFDVNRDGKLDESEKLRDANNNGNVGDEVDWQAFRKEHPAMKNLGGIFSWGDKLKVDNPFHALATVQMGKQEREAKVKESYERIQSFVNDLRQQAKGKKLSVDQQYNFILKALDKGGSFDPAQKKILILGIAYELDWTGVLGKIETSEKHNLLSVYLIERAARGYQEITSPYETSKFFEKIPLLVQDANFALQLDQGYDKAYYWKAFLYSQLSAISPGQEDKAIQHLDKAITLNPNYIEAYIVRGMLEFNIQNKAKAIADYNKAIELSKNNPNLAANAYYYRALTFISSEENEKGFKDIQKAFSLNPNSLKIVALYGITRLKYDDPKRDAFEALKLCEDLVARKEIKSDEDLMLYEQFKAVFHPI